MTESKTIPTDLNLLPSPLVDKYKDYLFNDEKGLEPTFVKISILFKNKEINMDERVTLTNYVQMVILLNDEEKKELSELNSNIFKPDMKEWHLRYQFFIGQLRKKAEAMKDFEQKMNMKTVADSVSMQYLTTKWDKLLK